VFWVSRDVLCNIFQDKGELTVRGWLAVTVDKDADVVDQGKVTTAGMSRPTGQLYVSGARRGQQVISADLTSCCG
jgi:hypothetical protein